MARERDVKGRFVARGIGAPGERRVAAKAPVGKGRLRKKDRDAIFFRELAILCNVSAALRKAGLLGQSSTVYEKRRTDPAFRARWDAAIDESWAMLELELLERARTAGDRPEPATEAERRLRAVPTGQALQLLKLHKGRARPAAAAPAAAPQAPRMTRARAREIRIRLEQMLSDFNRRMGGEG